MFSLSLKPQMLFHPTVRHFRSQATCRRGWRQRKLNIRVLDIAEYQPWYSTEESSCFAISLLFEANRIGNVSSIEQCFVFDI
jgi:hypothetical protein